MKKYTRKELIDLWINYYKQNNLSIKSDKNEDIYEIPDKIVIPPTTCTSSEKNRNKKVLRL